MARPVWPVEEGVKTAVRALQEGELLQLVIHFTEEEIQFLNSYKEVDPDSIAIYFKCPSPQVYSFYHYPGSNAVVLLWTRYDGIISTKRIAAQNGVRMDMLAIAEGQGIMVTQEIIVQGQDQISGVRLRDKIFLSKVSAPLNETFGATRSG
ncbi:uncharacterized protein N7482_006236 [Penicillium canariense]|uniref:Uncharacterized protein n=1 Tax=Penicillium canariense TaxID=189055 RepID=A0A9W9LNY1_9EURO|nr:uncharacterized protein N7482_006236 [Penicillium canariense]KAJ5167455.1 hypothetical protein N7482_006236 [Penicillium canariense]